MAKIAFNPLPWYLYVDGWHPERAPSLDYILGAIKSAGYDFVHAEIPADSTPKDYLALLSSKGLEPAPGYFQASFSQADNLPSIIESARKTAADHAMLGMDRIFLAEQVGVATERLAHPAQARAADAARLAAIIDGIGRVSEVMASEGVTPCLHQHIGTWIESAEEAHAVLAAVPEKVLRVGPDTGHLTWAGADPAAFIRKHRSRLGAIHIKDMRKSVAAAAKAEDLDYRAAGARHIWTEPGRGDLDFDAVFEALGDYDEWFVIEVDIADQPTIEETAAISASWLRQSLAGRS